MGEKTKNKQPMPSEPPAGGFTWVCNEAGVWREVPMEIRMPNEKPFFPQKTPPHKLPIDVTPPGPQNLN